MRTRRRFLGGVLATSLTPMPTWADAGNPRYLSAARTADGAFVLAGLDRNGQEQFRLSLPDRGHAAAAHPVRPEAVAFARRPGRFALVLDCRDGDLLAHLHSPEGRHFYGHGTFDAAGDLLFTTENDYKTGTGCIGIWDAARGYRRVGEIPSGGVGPHDIRRLPDDTLVVANGGIDTHPDTGREKLNLPTMRPNLSYLTSDGQLLDQIEPEHRLASIRHLAVRPDGLVGIGMQWQGDPALVPPLAAVHCAGHPLRVLGTAKGLDGYVGSVAFSGTGDQLAVTSPRGGRLRVFDLTQKQGTRDKVAADVCGVAPAGNGLFITTGLGHLIRTGTGGNETLRVADLAWDNHVVPITA